MFFKLFDVSAAEEVMEWRGQEAAIFNSSVFEYLEIPICWSMALVCNIVNFYFACVLLTGDADDSVNAELAPAGNGEVVGNMCNRSRYVSLVSYSYRA